MIQKCRDGDRVRFSDEAGGAHSMVNQVQVRRWLEQDWIWAKEVYKCPPEASDDSFHHQVICLQHQARWTLCSFTITTACPVWA